MVCEDNVFCLEHAFLMQSESALDNCIVFAHTTLSDTEISDRKSINVKQSDLSHEVAFNFTSSG